MLFAFQVRLSPFRVEYQCVSASSAFQSTCWSRSATLGGDVAALLADVRSATPGRRERLAARLVLILAPVLALLDLPDRAPADEPDPIQASGGIATFVERFLADDLGSPLALRDVAAQVNISVLSLTRRYRRETGVSVMTRLLDLRMRRAAELLQAGEVSVKGAGIAVGISDASYFCRCFRRAFGRSPGRFAARRMTPGPNQLAEIGDTRTTSSRDVRP